LVFTIAATIALAVSAVQANSGSNASTERTASLGESVLDGDGVRVTMLDLRRVSSDEYLASGCNASAQWPGGGFHAAFLVENRPGQPIPAVVGEVRIVIAGRLYNSITNANSTKPLAPCAIFRDVDDFFHTPYGQRIRKRPSPRPNTTAVAVEFYVRGGPIPNSSETVIEIEQGGTRLPEGTPSSQLRGDQITYRWFRFKVPGH